MADAIRVGGICTVTPGNGSPEEQLLGAQLAASYTRGRWPNDTLHIDLVERRVADDPAAAEAAATELVERDGCVALMGMSSVPVSTRLGEWCEDRGMLFMAANNNPVVRKGKHWVFGIGVPSEVTGEGTARALDEALGAKRVYLIHQLGEFQTYAAQCAEAAMTRRGIIVEVGELGDVASNDLLIDRVLAWGPDAVCLYSGSELEESTAFMHATHETRDWPPTLLSRSMLCKEFAELCGTAAEGHYFVDMFLRDERATEQERALLDALATHDPTSLATANHAFGWDGFRLVAEAIRAGGEDPEAQLFYIEGLKDYPGVTGKLTFGAEDHNGHFDYDPTTVSRLVDGRFVPFSSLGRWPV